MTKLIKWETANARTTGIAATNLAAGANLLSSAMGEYEETQADDVICQQ